MVIFGYDWWDEWMDRFSRCYHIISWWWTSPIVRFYPRGLVIYGEAHHIYDWGNRYNHTDGLHGRLEREAGMFVFTASTETSQPTYA